MSFAAYNIRQREIRRHVTGVLNFASRSLASEENALNQIARVSLSTALCPDVETARCFPAIDCTSRASQLKYICKGRKRNREVLKGDKTQSARKKPGRNPYSWCRTPLSTVEKITADTRTRITINRQYHLVRAFRFANPRVRESEPN